MEGGLYQFQMDHSGLSIRQGKGILLLQHRGLLNQFASATSHQLANFQHVGSNNQHERFTCLNTVVTIKTILDGCILGPRLAK